MSPNLSGIFPPITTPFDERGELLLDHFGANVDRWAAAPLAGVTVCGSNGESPYLTDAEKIELVRCARARVGKEKTLIVGAGKESTRLTIEFIRKVADEGADFALVGTPCYFKARMTDDALFAHFSAVANQSPIPILLYNVPQFTGVNLGAPLVARLAANPRVAGMKDSSANIQLQGEIRRSTPEGFKLIVGSGQTLLASLVQGACGAIVAIGCALPELTAELHSTFMRGEWQKAARIQERIAPPAIAVTTVYGVPGLKAALEMVGYHGDYPRLPLLPLGEPQRKALGAILAEAQRG